MRKPLIDTEIQNIINSVAKACVNIYRHISQISFMDKGVSKSTLNPSNEHSLYIDITAQNEIIDALSNIEYIYAIISEEEKKPIILNNKGKYIVSIDPLDGSSNLASNGPSGTIFTIFELNLTNLKHKKDIITLLQDANIVAAGYALYSTTLMLTCAIKDSIDMFIYNFQAQEYRLIYNTYKMPETPQYYSINEGYSNSFCPKTISLLSMLKDLGLKSRYSGALVAEIHRILVSGGIFIYPVTQDTPNGKIRLFFEAYPMAYIMRAAGGVSIDGNKQILDIIPQDLHQKTPVYMGNRSLINLFSKILHNL